VATLTNIQELLRAGGTLLSVYLIFISHLDSSSGALRYVGDHADDEVELDLVAYVEAARDGFLPEPRDPHLPVCIVRIDVVDVERQLSVDADRLDLADDGRHGTFEH
jgi:hypothetical protein